MAPPAAYTVHLHSSAVIFLAILTVAAKKKLEIPKH